MLMKQQKIRRQKWSGKSGILRYGLYKTRSDAGLCEVFASSSLGAGTYTTRFKHRFDLY